MVTLEELGPRICILGPSNSGKSTISAAIGRVRGIAPIHLDQLYHLPNTDWLPRPADEFTQLHDAAVKESDWVIEGNFSWLLPERLERATGIILLDIHPSVGLYRYLRRTWFERDRIGALEGSRDSVKWDMLHHVTVNAVRSRKHLRQLYDDASLAKVRLDSASAIVEFYRVNGLTR